MNIHISTWIDKTLQDIKNDISFNKYFAPKSIEKGTDIYYLFNPELGIDLILRENYSIKSVHFYSGNEKDIQPFKDGLPFELQFSFSRDKTRHFLGEPNIFGGGKFSFLYGITPWWDKYLFDKYSLHLQFSKATNKIDLITIDSLLN